MNIFVFNYNTFGEKTLMGRRLKERMRAKKRGRINRPPEFTIPVCLNQFLHEVGIDFKKIDNPCRVTEFVVVPADNFHHIP